MSLREQIFAEAYAKKFPDKPPYEKLSEREKREVRFYFENRGVIFNPRFGVTGRIGGYAALRDFTLASEDLKEADRAEEIARRAEEEEEKQAEVASAEEEELARAASPRLELRQDPARETAAKRELAALQGRWPQARDNSPVADNLRNEILDKAIRILEPYAKMDAKQHLGQYFTEEDGEEAAHDALAAWKAKVLKRVEQIRAGATNTKGQLLPDAFVGKKLGTATERNLIADIGRFVFNVVQSRRKTTANRARLAPMDPLASEHEGERGEDEPPIGHQVSTGETPASEITGAEQSRDIFRMFKTLSRELRRRASTEAADLLDAILKTHSYEDQDLASELGWTRKKVRNTRIVLSSYIKHRAKDIPELRRFLGIFGEAAERLCQQFPVLNLLLEGHFLPTRRSKSLASIYEKFASFRS
jgi:hypothetical protein